MEKYTFDNLRDIVLDVIKEPIRKSGLDCDDIDDDLDLLRAGYLDSFAFIDTVLALEKKTGITIDLGKIDAENFSSVGGMIRCVISAQ